MIHAARPSSTKKIAEVQSLKSLAIAAVLQNLLSVAGNEWLVKVFACMSPVVSWFCDWLSKLLTFI